MKQKDEEILMQMRTGKRMNMSEIARSLKLPVSTVCDRIKALEKQYVSKRPSLLEFSSLGFFAHAYVAIKVFADKKSTLLEFLCNEKCVNSVYHINSGFDFLVEVVFRNAIQLKEWVESARQRFCIDAAVFHVIKTEKQEVFMSK